MREKPKPCPFCGNAEIIFVKESVFFQCLVCGTLGPDGNDKITALELWNTRPEVDLICSDCNEKLVKMSYELEDGSGWIHGYLCGCKEECKEEVEEDIQTQTQV